MKHCLVVDDSDVIRKVAKRILEDLHMTSTEAESGQEAIDLCRRAMPDLILLDWQMPAMSSTDFLGILRHTPGGDQPVVVYCTTENDPDDIGRALEAGASAVLMKPFDKASLTNKLREAGLAASY